MNTSLKKELEHNTYVCICVSVCIYIQTHTQIERNIYISNEDIFTSTKWECYKTLKKTPKFNTLEIIYFFVC